MKPFAQETLSTLPVAPEENEKPRPSEQPGYYAGYSSLGQKGFWDPATHRTAVDRVENVPPIRFFHPEEAQFWHAVFDHLLPQTDRIKERRIPILNFVDQRLYKNQGAGYRFEDMPHDRDAYRLGMQAIDEEAQSTHQYSFVNLTHRQQEEILKAIHDGKPQAAAQIWERMSVHRFWQLVMGDAIDAYYAHPWAWDEIGFGGPAYPRAYMRLERGEPEPWEVEEQRHSWESPAETLSDETESTHDFFIESLQHRSHSKE